MIEAQKQRGSYKPENAEACCNNDKHLYLTVIQLNMVIVDYSTVPEKNYGPVLKVTAFATLLREPGILLTAVSCLVRKASFDKMLTIWENKRPI